MAGQLPAGQALGLVVGCIWPTSLVSLPWVLTTATISAVSPWELVADQAVWQVRALQRPAVGLLDGVFLDQEPLVAAVVEGPHELIGDVGVVGQGHLRRGEATHPSQRLQAEDGGEMVLPGAHVQPVVLYRGGRGDGVPPRAAQPLHGLPQVRVAGSGRRASKTSSSPNARSPCNSVPEYSSMIRGWLPSPSSWGMNSPIRL